MSMQRTWSRLMKRIRGKSVDRACSTSSTRFFQKIAAGVAGLGVLATANGAFGSTITAHDSDTTVNQNGHTFTIETKKKSGDNAFNSFNQFNLSANDITQMHLPNSTSNLINFVKGQITIDGIVNAIKNNKIGGNLYFLSAQGLVIGSGGVVNCGAFYAITPTQDFMDKFVKTNSLLIDGNETAIGHITSRKFVNHNGVKGTDGIPINSAGTITISGKVNAIDNIGACAGQTTLNNGAVLTTGITDFSAIVNTNDLPLGTDRTGLTMTSTADGNVELVAVADNADKGCSVSKAATGFSTFTKAVADAKVTVNGTITAKRNATIEAVAVNGKLKSTESVVEYGQTRTVEKYDSAKNLAEIKATVDIGSTASINADNDVSATAVAKNYYKSSDINLVDLGLSVAGLMTPVNISAEVAVITTKADVNIAQGAVLTAKNDLKLKAVSKSDVIVGASTSLAKIRQSPGGISAGAAYADVRSEANVTVNGSLAAGTAGDTSKGTVSVNAESMNYLDGTAASKTANDNAILCTGAVVANVRNDANIRISNTASVNAQKSVTVKSDTVSDVSTTAIAETGNDSYAGVAVNVTEFSSNAATSIACNMTTVAGNIDASANNLILQNRSTAKGSVGYTKISQALANVESNLVASIFSLTKFTGKFTGNLEATGSKFKAAGAIVYSQGTHGSKLDIGSNVKITAGDKLILKSSTVVQDLFMQADSTARSKMTKADGTKVSVSAGIIYSDVAQTSEVRIADAIYDGTTGNGTVLTGTSVQIDSTTRIEYNRVLRMIQAVEDAVAQLKSSVSDEEQLELVNGVEAAYNTIKTKFSSIGAEGLTTSENISAFVSALGSLSSMAGALANLVTNETGVVAQAAKIVSEATDFASFNNFLNMYAVSAIKGANDDNSKDIGFAGTVGLNDFTSKSDVIVGRNVTVTALNPGAGVVKSVEITANTAVDAISATGHIIPSTGSKSFGGVYQSQEFTSTSRVTVAEGADMIGAGKDISVSASNDARTVVVGLSSAMAGSGIEGMVARVVGISNSTVQIDDEVDITGKNIGLSSYNNTKALTAAGAVMITSAVSVAAGVAINDFQKDNNVFVGDIDERYQDLIDEKDGVDKTTTPNSLRTRTGSDITAAGTVEAQAKSTGGFISVGVAGGITKNDDTGSTGFLSSMMQKYNAFEDKIAGTINSLGSKFTNITSELSSKTSNSGSGTHQNPSFSLSLSGSAGLNFIDSVTKVDISGATINLGGTAGSNLNVSAINCSDAMAFAGSAGIMWQKSASGGGRSVGIAGAVGVNDVSNTTEAIVRNGTINDADDVRVFAVNGGIDVAAGLGLQLSNNKGNAAGAFTMGGSVSVNNIDNTVTSTLKDTNVTGKDTLKTDVNVAAYESDVQVTGGVQLTIGKEKGAFGAAVNVSDITNTVKGQIENGTFTKVKDVTTSALQALTQVSGALTAGIIWGTDNTTSIMGALIYNKLKNDLTSVIKGATITADGTVSANTRDYRTGNAISGFESLLERSDTGVESFISTDGTDYYDVDASNDTETTSTPLKDQVKNGALIVTGAMAISAADNAAGAAVVINDITNTFHSKIDSSTITAGTIKSDAQAASFLVTAAGGAAVSTKNGAGGGSVVWNGISNDVKAGALNSTLTAKTINAKALNGIRMISVAGGSVSYNKIQTTNSAFIDGGAVITAADNIGVVAQTDDTLMNYAGVLAIGGTAGVGAAVAINYILGDTKAYIDSATLKAAGTAGGVTVNNAISDDKMNSGFISDQSVNILYTLENQRTSTTKTGIVVDSSATHTMKSFVANAAGAGSVALAGTVNVNQIDGNTNAYIKNATLNLGATPGDVSVNAADYTNCSGFVGSVGGAGTIGIGASSDTNKVRRNTSAKLEDIKTGSLAKAAVVNAVAKQGLSSVAAGLGVGGSAGIAGTVSVAMLSGATEAVVSNSLLTADSLTVNAEHWAKTYVLDATAAIGGYAGIGGAVAVNDIRDTVKSEVVDSTVQTTTDGVGAIQVKAKNYALLNATSACVGGGFAGIAGNVSVNYMQNEVTVSVKNSSLGTAAKRADSIVIKAENSSNIDSNIGAVAGGVIAAGASVGVNTLDGKVRTVVDGSSLYAKNNIDILADESRTVTQYAFTAAGGALGLAGNVMYVAAGQVLSATNEDGNKEIRDALSAGEQVNSGSIGGTNGALTADEQTALNGTSNKLSAQEAGKSATTVAVGNFDAANASIINSSAGAVKIGATENTNTTMTGGAAAAGGCAAGGSVGIATVNRNVGTTVSNATVNAAGNIDVTSEVKGNTNLNMYQGSAGTFAAGTAAYGKIGASGNALTAVSNSTLKNSGTITIGAKDTTGANAQSYGLTAGQIAAGGLVTQIDNNGAANVNLSANTLETSSGIAVNAEKQNSLTAKTVGGALGLAYAGTGIAATVNDTGNAAITMTSTGSSFKGSGITFTSTNKPTAVSEATSASIGGLVSGGVSVANSTMSGKALVNVSGGNVFIAPTVSFNGMLSGTNTVKSVGVSGGFVGSFGYNESNAYNTALVNVIIGNNTYDAATALKLYGTNIVTQSADTSGLNVGGLLASGNNKARTVSNTTTKVDLAGDATTARAVHSIDIKADSSSVHTVKADGNGGGLVSVDGLSAYAINSITTLTEAAIGGKWSVADTLKLFANQYDRVSMNADSIRGTLVGYSGTKAENTIKSVTKTNVQDNAQIDAGSDVEFQAKNTISSGDESGFSASGAGYGGITVNGAASTLTVTSTTEARVGSNAKITAKGSITGNAMTDAALINKVRAVGAGVVANPLADSENTVTINNKLITAAGSLLKTTVAGKSVNLAASTKLTAKLTSDSDMQGGLGGYSHAKTVSHITKNNTLDIYGDLFSTNDINLYTDANAAGQRSVYDLTATADSYNKNSVVAVAKAELDSWTSQSNGINIFAGSNVQSVRHINLHATPGKEVMTEAASEYTWYSTDVTGGYASTASGQRSKNITSNNYVNIGGSLVAGIYNKVNLTFNGTVDFLGAVTDSITAPIITSTVEDYKKGVTYGTTNYANDLFTRYQEVCRLATEYAGSKAGIGYEAEKERLLGEMEKYGLYDSSSGLVIGGMTVQYIALPDMVCSGGNVVIDTDGVVGNGSVNAKGSPEINVTNNTNLYMKVNDLTIEDYGGEVILNGISLGNTAATKLPTLSSVSTSDSSSALISVKETWNGNLQVTSGGRTEYRTPLTTIEVNGDISNPLGKVSIDNTKGDIVIQGKTAQEGASIQGREIELKASAGSISQGYTQGIVNIGATPEYLYKSFGDTAAAAIDGHEESDTERQKSYNTIDESLQNGTWIAGGSVFINASDININGLIQSGYAEYKITLSTDAQNKINQYDYYYYGQNITPDALRNYKLNDGGAKYIGGIYTYEVQAFYNPQTKQIILEDIDPQGGKIYLTGRISSTGNGRLVAADGSADISVTNGTDKAITVGKVNVGDLDGVIKITDTEKNTVTELRRDSTTTSNIGSTVKTVSGTSSAYSPKSGLYYNWSSGYEQTTYEHYGYSQGFSWWGGYTWNAGTISEKETLTNRLEYRNGSSNKLQGTYVGTPTGASGEYTIFYKNDVGYNNPWYNNWISYDNWTHFSGTEYYDWGKNIGKVVTFQHSLNASHDIGVSFIGSTSGGSINLTSSKDVNLTGNVTGVTGTAINITSSNGAISQTGGTIIGNDITLSANTGIGNSGSVYQQVLGDSCTLRATTNTGNLDIRSFASIGKQGNLLLTATTNSGDVKIEADGSILQSGSSVSAKGDRIDLVSRNGSIGQSGNSLLVQAGQTPANSGDTMSASLNAHARGDVYMTQTTGDMRLGRVESDIGDVNLVVSAGSFNNVLPATEDSSARKGDDLVAKWIAMGLINADGSDNGALVKSRAIADYENGVKSEFANYLAQKAIYDANPDLVESTAFIALESKYATYATADDYLAAKAVDTGSMYYKISHELYGWSKDSLLYALQKSIINPTSGSSQTLIRPANVKGRNITLTALNGGIGKDEAAEEVSIVDLGSNLDTLKKLAGAEASDVTWDEAAGKAVIRRTTAIGIEMTDPNGSLNATAKNNIYIAAATDDPIYLNNINANTSNIRLLGKSGIYNVSVVPNGVNLNGRDLLVEGGSNGSNSFIGTADKPIVTNMSGKVTARAEGLINLYQTGLDAMRISAIFGGSDVKLRSTKDLLSVNSGIVAEDLGYTNAEGRLTLISDEGNIGEDGKGIRILADNTDAVDAVGNNVYIAGEALSAAKPALSLGNISARNGGVLKLANADSGVHFGGNVTAGTMGITADSVSQDVTTGYIKTTTLSAVTQNGLSLNNPNNEIGQAALSNMTAGNLELRTNIDLTLNGVSNSGLTGNIGITGDGDVTTSQNITGLGNVSIIAAGDFQSTAAFSAGGNAGITSGKSVVAHTIAAGNDASVTALSGNLTIDGITAGNNVSLDGTDGDTLVTSAVAGNDLSVSITNGDISLTDANAGNNLEVTTTAGNITLARGTATGGNAVVKTSAGTITINDKLMAGLTTLVEATAAIIANTIESGGTATVRNSNGDIDLESITTTNAGADIEVRNTGSGNIDIATANAARDLIISALNGGISLLTGTSGNSTSITSGIGNIVLESLNAGRNIAITTGQGAVTATTVAAGNDAAMTAQDGNITVTGVSAGNDLSLTGINGDASVTNAAAGNDLSVSVTNGDISLTDANAGNNLEVTTTAGNITLARGTATGGNAVVKTSAGTITISDKLKAGLTTLVEATAAIIANTIESGGTATVRNSNGDIDLESITTTNAGADIEVRNTGSGNIDIATANAARDLIVSALNGGISLLTGTSGNSTSITSGIGNIVLESLNAGRNIAITTGQGAVTATTVAAGNDAAMTAQDGNIAVTGVSAGNDLSLTGINGDASVTNAATGNDLSVSVTNGDISLTDANAGNNLEVTTTAGNITLARGTATGGNAVVKTSAGNITISDKLKAGLTTLVEATAAIIANTIESGGTATVRNSNGDIDLESITTMNAGSDVEVRNTGSGNIDIAAANAARDLIVSALNGGISLLNGTSGNSTIITSGIGNIVLESLNAGRNIGITTGQGAVTATTVAAGNDAAMSAQNGNITVSDIAAGNDLSLTGINGNTSVTRSAAGNDLTVSVTNGAIAMANVSAGNDLTTRSTQGNTVIGTANAGGNTAMTVSNGNIEVSSARSGSDMLLRTDSGNVTLTNGYAGHNMTVNADVGNALLGTVESGYDLTVDLNRGTIDVADAVAGHNLLLKTLVGDIFIGHAKSLTGDLIVKTEDGAMRVRDGLDAGQDSLFISNEGPVYLENVQVSKDIVIKTNSGDISINNIRSENGDVTISTVQNGDLMIENVYAGEDVNFTTGSGGIISGGTIESGGGSVNLIANGPGNINVHEILAKEDVTAQAENGEIVIGQLNGRNVVLGVAHDGERVEVGNTRLEGTMSITADKIFMDHIEHLVDDEYFRLHLKGVQNSAMDDVSIDSINSAAGVQLEGLWSNTAEIHSDCDYFRLRDVYIVDRGYLSNDSLTMTVFGRNPVRDGSDIQAYFVPDAEHPFTQISFQNEFSSLGRECYEILYNTNGNKTPFNQLNMMEECDATVQSEQQALAAARNIFLSPLESAPLNAGISYTSAEIINMAAGVQNGGTVIEGSRIVAGGELNRTEPTMNTSETETNE